MEKSKLLPPHQIALAGNALVGDPASQRAVLEMVVILADAGIEPVDVLKKAALESLRVALKNNKLQSPKNANIKGAEGKEFETAVEWWKAELTGHQKSSTVVANQLDPSGKKNMYPAISRAKKLHKLLARERALHDLAFFGEEGYPSSYWLKEWDAYRRELLKPSRELIDTLPEETAKLLKRNF